ncbi:MAG: enoyl-CoA hydratase-related protein [Tateyamaria sp.]|uniref:enoyl-CoA hydratase-related protein n=1 Tax=Tateyamaria sp. TaxID=1929288 RepID=UPI00329AA182
MIDETETVLFARNGAVAIITLNRPEQRNAVNGTLAEELRKAVIRFESDASLRVAILTGHGRTFCAGMDLAAFLEGQGDAILFGEGRFAGFVDAERSKPIIAAVEGAAIAGGMELTLACDMIVAGTSAYFGLPEVAVGIFPVAGGAFRLARKIPPAKAMQVCLTAQRISAQEGLAFGLVNELVPDGEALTKAMILAECIARNASRAVEAAYTINRRVALKNEAEMWALSEELWGPVASSTDASEGPKAFKEKRKPVWSNETPDS